MKLDLSAYVSEFTLRRLAGAQEYRLGMEYFQESRVTSLKERSGSITATVLGSEKYRTQLKIDRLALELEFSCSCPQGMEGRFCKHLVATGLAWLSRRKSEGAKRSGRKAPARLTVPEWLARQKKSVLVEIVLEHADDDDDFWNWLEMHASINPDGTIDVDRLRKCLSTVILAEDFIDCHESYDYFCRVGNALDILENLLETGHAAEVMELCEHALSDVETAMDPLGDSGDSMDDIISGLVDIHHRACRKARPNRREMARKLFEWELGSKHDIFSGASELYADILQKEGLAEYRRLAEKAWTGVKPLGPGEKVKYDACRYRLRNIMETLARREGNVDFLAEIKKRDLTRPVCFLEIARLYQEAGRHEEALAWAERGVSAFEKNPDIQLLDFLADIYHRQGNDAKALDLVWKSFCLNPGLSRYRSLKIHARRQGSWPEWREKATELIRRHLEQGTVTRNRNRGPMRLYNRVDHSLLVQILMEDNDLDAAWEEALKGGCSDSLWMQLALRREKTHPEDSLMVYQQQIGSIINCKSSDAYQEAMRLLGRIRDLMVQLGRAEEFGAYLQKLGAEHGRKRSFMKLLGKKKWV
ncbi:MAG: DUF6880 family protein [Desulfomonilia bacterium]|jgi:uncharacterized Zn finger protein